MARFPQRHPESAAARQPRGHRRRGARARRRLRRRLGRRFRPLLLLRCRRRASSRATTSSACWRSAAGAPPRRQDHPRPAPDVEHHRHGAEPPAACRCMCKTGHAFIKERMRAENAIYGGEMSAHHYFRDFAYCDSGMIPWLLVAAADVGERASLAELVEDRMRALPVQRRDQLHGRQRGPRPTGYWRTTSARPGSITPTAVRGLRRMALQPAQLQHRTTAAAERGIARQSAPGPGSAGRDPGASGAGPLTMAARIRKAVFPVAGLGTRPAQFASFPMAAGSFSACRGSPESGSKR